jgi:tRNA pseudouridine32 synthase/23S rRNA pseudouridine746 synthase
VTTPGIAVLHEDAQLLAIDKPAGRLVIPGRGRGEQSLVEELSGTHGRLDRKSVV